MLYFIFDHSLYLYNYFLKQLLKNNEKNKKINYKGNRSLTSKFRECTCLPQKIEENVQINEKQKTSISQLYIL